MPSRIEDHALLADTRTALLDENGRWQIAPHGLVRATRRRYRGDTPVLETDFDTDEGSIRLVDFIPPLGKAAVVVRLVEGVRGRVHVHMELSVRCDSSDSVWLRTPVDTRDEGGAVRADFFVSAGELVPFVLTRQPSQQDTPAAIDPFRALADTESYWTEARSYPGRSRTRSTPDEGVLSSIDDASHPSAEAAESAFVALGSERSVEHGHCRR